MGQCLHDISVLSKCHNVCIIICVLWLDCDLLVSILLIQSTVYFILNKCWKKIYVLYQHYFDIYPIKDTEGCENTNSIGLISEYVLTSGYPTIMARAMFPSCSTMLKVSLSQHPLLNIKTFSIIWTSLYNLLEGHTCVVDCPIQLTLIFMTLYLSFVFYKKCHSFKCEETQQGYLPYGTFLKTQLR